MSSDFAVSAQIPKGLTALDFDTKAVRQGLRRMAAQVRKDARAELSVKRRSKAGEAPGRLTGALRKSLQVVNSRPQAERRKNYIWARVQYGSKLKDKNGAFYAAPLMHGRRDGTLQARMNVLPAMQEQHRAQFSAELEDLLIDNIKGWGE